jgi:ERCC4-type nuclease
MRPAPPVPRKVWNCHWRRKVMGAGWMIIIADTREQRPYDFSCIVPPPAVEVSTLNVGDYSLKGFTDQISIERKSLLDTYGTFGQGRARFQRELERAIKLQFFAVVIESQWDEIVKRPPSRSRLNPKTIVASIAAWCQRFPNVHFFTVPGREFGERFTFRLLERFHKDRLQEQRNQRPKP